MKVYIYPKMASRHGLIPGAIGTGKTVTLKVLAESFSDCGVGICFITQNPADIPDDVLGQLGNKVHHALRAYELLAKKVTVKKEEEAKKKQTRRIMKSVPRSATGTIGREIGESIGGKYRKNKRWD